MTGSNRNSGQAILLRIANAHGIPIASIDDLVSALEGASHLESGKTISLTRDSNHYIRATRRGQFWSVVKQSGGWWTKASFTAGMTTDYSERQAREAQSIASLRKHVLTMVTSPAPEYALSTAQVETIMVEYFLGKRFTVPLSGA